MLDPYQWGSTMNEQRAAGVHTEMHSGRRGTRMPVYSLRLPPEEIIRVIKAEIAATSGAPEFYVYANADFIIEEDYDRDVYGVRNASQYDLVMSESVLGIEPRIERNYWILSVIVRKVIGPRIIADENSFIGSPLSLDEFAARLANPEGGSVRVRLEIETPLAKSHFDAWWAELAARHPHEPGAAAKQPPSSAETKADDPEPAARSAGGNAWAYRAREAVGVFAAGDDLETAIADLEMSGFDRASISVLGSDKAVEERIGRLYQSVAEAEDDPKAPRSAFISRGSRLEGEAAAITFPFFIGGLAGVFAVVASGGALAAAIAATVLGSAAGAGVGGLLARTIARHHREQIEERLSQGGLVVWVSAPDEEAAKRALTVLGRHGGQDLHIHEIELEWGPKARPLAEAQVDPFLLERDPPL
jgi:hypothetical protein